MMTSSSMIRLGLFNKKGEVDVETNNQGRWLLRGGDRLSPIGGVKKVDLRSNTDAAHVPLFRFFILVMLDLFLTSCSDMEFQRNWCDCSTAHTHYCVCSHIPMRTV